MLLLGLLCGDNGASSPLSQAWELQALFSWPGTRERKGSCGEIYNQLQSGQCAAAERGHAC